MELPYDPVIPLKDISQKIENRIPKRCVYTCVHCSITHSGQERETTPSVKEQMRKEKVVYIYTGILCSLEKYPVTPHNVDETLDIISEISQSHKQMNIA